MKREKGFTLIEVIIAMAILAAGIMAAFALFSGALRLSGGSRDLSEAAIYADQRMEEALLAPNPVEGKEHGYFGDKYKWELSTSIVLHEMEAGEGEKERAYEEIQMTVTISWMDGKDMLSTEVSAARLRMAGKKDEGA